MASLSVLVVGLLWHSNLYVVVKLLRL
jgi:hypothetical protein